MLISSQEQSGGDVIAMEMYVVCDNPHQTYWLAAVYVYKGLLLIFGTFLAWETRKVSIAVLNDSRLIGFCVYNVVVICAFAVPVNHVLSDTQSTLRFVISSAFTIFCTTLVLCIVFVPKVTKSTKVCIKGKVTCKSISVVFRTGLSQKMSTFLWLIPTRFCRHFFIVASTVLPLKASLLFICINWFTYLFDALHLRAEIKPT